MSEKPANLPYLIQANDFRECGLVYKCLKANPEISDAEIAGKTRLLRERVASLRLYLEYEYGFKQKTQDSLTDLNSSKNKSTLIKEALDNLNFDYPVPKNLEYIGRVVSIDENNFGMTNIETFPCKIGETNLGELVKFRIIEINPDFATAEIVRLVQTSSSWIPLPEPDEVVFEPDEVVFEPEQETTEKLPHNCKKCFYPLSFEDFELHDGLCNKCYYRKLRYDVRKTDRRSGLLGTDRAGTW